MAPRLDRLNGGGGGRPFAVQRGVGQPALERQPLDCDQEGVGCAVNLGRCLRRAIILPFGVGIADCQSHQQGTEQAAESRQQQSD
jgi:hypothetical protein